MKTLRLIALSVAAGAIASWVVRTSRYEEQSEPKNGRRGLPVERRAEPDPEALVAAAALTEKVGVDLSRLKDLSVPQLQPLVEYLTYIQVQRGASESLVFVRHRDMDAMAGMAGASDGASLMNEFKRLGVAVSMN